MITLASVNKTYNNRVSAVEALRGVALEIPTGDFVALVGPSGSGKSTILKIIAGIEPVTAGNITVFGKTPHSRGQSEQGIMFQNYNLFPWLTVFENIAFGLRQKNLAPSEIKKTVTDFINATQLTGFEQARPSELSGGMQQRVALARTLITKPKLLLLDEPFGALDTQTRRAMRTLLLHLWGTPPHATVILVTHDVEEALFLSDRICVLGGTPAKIMAEVVVSFARPRRPEFEYTAEFVALKRKIQGLISSL